MTLFNWFGIIFTLWGLKRWDTVNQEKIVVYQDLENIYVLCMRKVISTACENAWGGTKEGAFGRFKKLDKENTETVNKLNEQEGKNKIVSITSKAKSFNSFDFQACNTTFAHLEGAYSKIYSYYKILENDRQNCTSISKDLVLLRNKLAHPQPSDPPSKTVERQQKCINYMNVIFGLGFSKVADENGVPFYEQFQTLYIDYINQQLQRWYYLSDFLDLKLYDASLFLETCAASGIKATKKDGKYLFCSSRLEKDLAILKNNLIISGDASVYAQKTSTLQEPSQNLNPTVKKKNFNPLYVIIPLLIALLLGLAILIVVLISIFSDAHANEESKQNIPTSSQKEDITPNNTAGGIVSQSTEQSEVVESMAPPQQSTPSNTDSTNQIPQKHQSLITATEHSDPLSLQNKTLYVNVGEYVTPPPASIWGDVTIYSQDTTVAVGEGILVKGVSKGTTYIIVESRLGSAAAFCIVVK